jgi:epoxyqueuosine reductase
LLNKIDYTELIRSEAKAIGFSGCGFSTPSTLSEDNDYFIHWLKMGMNGEMNYMKNYPEKRLNSKLIYEETQSIITVLLNYNTAERQKSSPSFKVSKYAYFGDYHFIIKAKLKKLLNFIKKNIKDADGRYFVDTAPIFERSVAKNSGLGWIGKNSCLITKKFGSFVFIGELLLNIELNYDKPSYNYCGNCTKCIDACPTKAIVSPYVIDANKCISYLTVEHKSDIPNEFKNKLENWIFGCDICQDVCPWNKKNKTFNNELNINSDLMNFSAAVWKNLSPEQFEKISKSSALNYISYEQLKRNIKCNMR